MRDDASHGRQPNLLIKEKSPYLIQHAYNPVMWRPWSDDAFQESRALDRPVFLSIGYATCHWCHVMENESFEDPDVAAYLNNNFICIKVDREERPDVDSIYMDVCQAMTGHGGWPLTIFTNADKLPFFAGTYFPRTSRGNRVGFLDLIQRIKHAWNTDRDRIEDSSREVFAMLREGAEASFSGEVPEDIFTIVADHHRRTYDDTFGGFGVQPKFPSPHHLLLLFRIGKRRDDPALITMALHQLNAMRAGGIYDHVGFGFHRYSTDREWLVPHYEKMLYDQAMLMMAYSEAWQITKKDLYRDVCVELAEYVQRELTGNEGAFYSAQDADSEGVEGQYYVWGYDELEMILSRAQLQWIEDNKGVRREGNARDESTGEESGKNILHDKARRTEEGGRRTSSDEVEWEEIRSKLLDVRSQRVPPLTDDKVLTDWNGLMITALARAGRALANDEMIGMATRAYHAVAQLCGGSTWVHRYRDGHRSVDAMLDDHAAMGLAAIELYQCTGSKAYLDDANAHADAIVTKFTTADGSLARTATDTDLPVRVKESFDSAYPSGNSLSAWLFTELSTIVGDAGRLDAARSCVVANAKQLQRYAPGYCMLLCVWDVLLHGGREIRLVGGSGNSFLNEAYQMLAASYLPDAAFAWTEDAGTPHVQVCTNNVCERPFTTLEAVREFIERTVPNEVRNFRF